MKAIIALALIVVVESDAMAGGTSWAVRIAGIKRNAGREVVVTIIPLEDGGRTLQAGCSEVTLRVRHKKARWWRKHGSPGTSSENDLALAELERAAVAKSATRIGEMGEGFGRSRSTPCVIESFGLKLVSENGDTLVPYSYFKWP